MLDHLGQQAEAEAVRAAVQLVYQKGRHLTCDLGGIASTNEFADAVIAALESTRARGSAPV